MDKRIYIPEKWNALNDWQLSKIGQILYEGKPLEKKVYQFYLLFIIIMNRPTLANIRKAVFIFRQIPFSELQPCLSFIFDDNDLLTRFFPKIKIGRTTLYGPADRLANISIGELSYADAFFYKWITAGDPKDLQRLVACLYRPAGATSSENDPRKEFDKLLLPKNAVLTDKIPMHKQYVIALAYQGSRRIFRKRYKHIFPPAAETEEEAPKKKQSYQPFSKLINSMAMDDVQIFGTLQETEKTNAVQFMDVYDELLHRQMTKR